MEASCQLHAPAALPPGKELLVPMDRRLGGPRCEMHTKYYPENVKGRNQLEEVGVDGRIILTGIWK